MYLTCFKSAASKDFLWKGIVNENKVNMYALYTCQVENIRAILKRTSDKMDRC